MGHAVDSECACVYLYAMPRIVATRAMAAAAAPLLPPSPAAQLGNLQELVDAVLCGRMGTRFKGEQEEGKGPNAVRHGQMGRQRQSNERK